MSIKAGGSVKPIQEISDIEISDIPASAVREYISDMLAELCVVAKKGGQEDLYALLKLTTQAARNVSP